MNHRYVEKRLALIDFFQLVFGNLNEVQKAVLDKAVNEAYAKAGVSEKNYWNKIPPKLGDVYEELEKLEKRATGFEKATYVTLLSRLSMYVTGVFSFLNQQTEIDVKNSFVTFNLGHMPKQVKPVMMFLILEYVYAKMKGEPQKKLLVIDEAWSLLSRAEDEGYIFEIVKTCRKFNMGLLLITQDVADLLNSKAGRAVLANSSYTILLRQKAAIISSVEEVFHLSYAEREHLLTSNVGEGLLMMENDHQELQIIASPEEHQLITTKPEELFLTQQAQTLPVDAQKLIKELYPLKDVYKNASLKDVQKEYLENLQTPRFTEESLNHPYAHRPALYKIKIKRNESPKHTAICWWIYEELLNYTPTARLIHSHKNDLNPDIIFANESGQEVAIEVETGSNYKFNHDYLQSKITKLDTQYPSCWCFFLTTNGYLSRYQKLTTAPIHLRKHLHRFIKHHFPSGIPPLNTTPRQKHENTDENKKNIFVSNKNIVVKNNPQKQSVTP